MLARRLACFEHGSGQGLNVTQASFCKEGERTVVACIGCWLPCWLTVAGRLFGNPSTPAALQASLPDDSLCMLNASPC